MAFPWGDSPEGDSYKGSLVRTTLSGSGHQTRDGAPAPGGGTTTTRPPTTTTRPAPATGTTPGQYTTSQSPGNTTSDPNVPPVKTPTGVAATTEAPTSTVTTTARPATTTAYRYYSRTTTRQPRPTIRSTTAAAATLAATTLQRFDDFQGVEEGYEAPRHTVVSSENNRAATESAGVFEGRYRLPAASFSGVRPINRRSALRLSDRARGPSRQKRRAGAEEIAPRHRPYADVEFTTASPADTPPAPTKSILRPSVQQGRKRGQKRKGPP